MFGVWKRSFKFGLLPERASLACWICSFMVSYSENKAINDVIGANSDKLCWNMQQLGLMIVIYSTVNVFITCSGISLRLTIAILFIISITS